MLQMAIQHVAYCTYHIEYTLLYYNACTMYAHCNRTFIPTILLELIDMKHLNCEFIHFSIEHFTISGRLWTYLFIEWNDSVCAHFHITYY